MNDSQKKLLKTMCNCLNYFCKRRYPLTDKDWESCAGYIDVLVENGINEGLNINHADEIRTALFKVVEEWELKQKNE